LSGSEFVERRPFRAGVSAALVLATLPSPAAAHGDVRASVDAAGDLWLLGDELANGIRLEAGGDDQNVFRIRGLDPTTTVNGLPEVTLAATGTRMILFLGDGENLALLGTDYGGEPSCCARELLVVGGAGDDQVFFVGGFRRVTADLGPGNDSLHVDEGASGIRGTLLMGTGDDLLSLDEFTGAEGSVDLGPGNDLFLVGKSSFLAGTFDLGPGDDSLLSEGVRGTFELRGDTGDDTLEIRGLAAGALTLDAGAGADDVRILGDTRASGAAPLDPLDVRLGLDDDRLAVGSAAIARALFDGGLGADLYLDLGGNAFAQGAPELRSFELPKGTRGSAVDLVTTVVGRVVDERGRPVPLARVVLPELALAGTTDPWGAFALGPLADARAALELVVGATLDGRARSGAALARLVPLGTTDVGDVVLQPVRRNVLALGAPSYRAAALEANLRALDYRPEEVTRLDALPEELSPYAVVWHVGGTIPAAARPLLAEFVRAGGGLFLSGGSRAVNSSVEALVNGLVSGGGIQVGVTGTATSPFHAFQPGAAGGVATSPNALAAFERSAFSRFVGGLQPRNELVLMTTSPDVPGAVWDARELSGHRGRLLLVTDATWLMPGESLDVLENFQRFLARQPRAQGAR
jgi:hypothetical protein